MTITVSSHQGSKKTVNGYIENLQHDQSCKIANGNKIAVDRWRRYTHNETVWHGLRWAPVEHSGGVKLAKIQFRVSAWIRLSESNDNVFAVERRWKTGRVSGRSTISSHTDRQKHIIVCSRIYTPVLQTYCRTYRILCLLTLVTQEKSASCPTCV